jgi:hypothetical protein
MDVVMGLAFWMVFFSLIFHLVLVNDKKSGFDEFSFVSQFLPILIVISYQHPIFL